MKTTFVIRTKTELEQAIVNGRKFITADDKLAVYDKLARDILNVLTDVDGAELFPPLANLKFDCSFEDYVMSATIPALEIRLKEIFLELRGWRSSTLNVKFLREKNFIYEQNRKKLISFQHNDKKTFVIFMILFAIFSAIVVVSAIIPIIPSFEDDDKLVKICNCLVGIAGALDFVNGVAFGVREIVNDRRKTSENTEVENALKKISGSERDVIVNNSVTGNGNISNFGSVTITKNKIQF